MSEKIIVIGGGIAGLSAGIYARLADFDAVIYEKNPVCGGECIGWNRKGFHIDNCIHWLTGTKKGTPLYDVWKTIGAIDDDTVYAPINAFFAYKEDGKVATLWYDLEKTEKELIELSPEDEKEIKRFIKYVNYAKCCHYPAGKPIEMFGLSEKISMAFEMKDMIKVMMKYGNMSLEEYGSKFKSPILRDLFIKYLPPCYTAYSFLVAYASMCDGNGNVPEGGSRAMVSRIIKRFKDLGGEIKCNKHVQKIEIKDGKATTVVLTDGSEDSADYIISAVDPSVLFGDLVSRDYAPDVLKKAYEDEDSYPVTSGFQVAFSADKGLYTDEMTFTKVRPVKVGTQDVDSISLKSYEYEEDFGNEGRVVLQTIVWQTDPDYKFWKNLPHEEYGNFKRKTAEEILERLEEVYPNLQGNIEILDVWTPLTYERYCGAYHGSYMSFITKPHVKQVNMDGRIRGLDNLIVAGQWTAAPGGLPMAACSGKFAVQRIKR